MSSEGRIPEIPPRILARWWPLGRPETWPLILSTNKYMAWHRCCSLSFPRLHFNIQSIALYILLSIPMGHGHVSEVGCCLRVLPICGCNSASGPSTLVQAKKSRAGCTFCRSFDVVVKSTTRTLHFSTVVLCARLQAPVVVVLRGNRPGNLGLGPELPALWTTYPAPLYK